MNVMGFIIPPLAIALVVFLITFLVSLTITYLVFRVLYSVGKRATAMTKNDLDDRLLESSEDPIKLFLVLLSLFIATTVAFPYLTFETLTPAKVFVFLLIFNVAFLLDRLARAFIEWYSEEIAPKTKSKLDDEFLPLARKLLRFIIYTFALLIGAGYLGIEITPLLTGLGIAGLAVALALQDSLSNFFAGINITVDRPVKPGDYIEIEGGISGTVEDIGWRTTKIKTWDGNVIFIPNKRLAESIILNWHAPNQKYVLSFTIGASYEDDVDTVMTVIKEVIEEVKKKFSKEVDTKAETTVRVDKLDNYAIIYKGFIKLRNYSARFTVLSEIYRLLYYKFKEHNITIPYPIQHIVLEKGGKK